MSLKHLAGDAKLPTREDGKLRLYGMVFCPFAQRPRLVLAHKNIPCDVVNINLKNKPEWFWERNPNGTVPIIEADDFVMYESLIVCDWLNDSYPRDNLYSEDPNQRAMEKLLIQHCSKVTGPFYESVRASAEDRPAAVEKFYTAVEFYEKHLNADYFGGSKVNMVDLMIWPFFERVSGFELDLPADRFPKMNQWMTRMLQLPAVKDCLISTENYKILRQEFYIAKPTEFDFDRFL